MNTTLNTHHTDEELKLRRRALRKRRTSKLDGFGSELVRLEAENKTIDQMLDWLRERGLTTARGNLSKFLRNRREEAELKALREELTAKVSQRKVLEEWVANNPQPDLKTVTDMFQLLALELVTDEGMDLKRLRLADRLVGQVITFMNRESREAYRARKLKLEEEQQAEWMKCERTHGPEFRRAKAKRRPAMANGFWAVVAAFKKRQEEDKGMNGGNLGSTEQDAPGTSTLPPASDFGATGEACATRGQPLGGYLKSGSQRAEGGRGFAGKSGAEATALQTLRVGGSNGEYAGWDSGLSWSRLEPTRVGYYKLRGVGATVFTSRRLVQDGLMDRGKAIFPDGFPARAAGFRKLPASGYSTGGRAGLAFVKPLEHVPTI